MIVPITSKNYDHVTAIYTEGISSGIATFETKVPEWSRWDKSHLPFGRIAMESEGTLVGWGALSPVSDRCVYGGVAEVSVYVSSQAQGKGVGTLLLNELVNISEQNNIWTLQAGVFKENIASIDLHKKCGFRVIGYREKVGQLKGVWYDNLLLERRSSVVGI